MSKFKKVGEICSVWDTLCETWDETDIIWDECEPILKKIKGGSRGGVRKDKDLWNEWDKLNWKNKQKVYRCICLVKGVKYEQQKEIKKFDVTVKDIDIHINEDKKHAEFDVTVKDIEMLINEYEKRTLNIEIIKVE